MSGKNKKILGSAVTVLLVLLLLFIRSPLFDRLIGGGSESDVVSLETAEPDVVNLETMESDATPEELAKAVTPRPEKTEKPTPEPAAAVKPTEKPTATPKPEKTAKPTATPKATVTPKPENTATAETALKFRSKKLLDQHYEKHGKDMGFANAKDYEAAAAAVVANPDALHKIEKEDGDDIYYLEETNEFVVVSTDGYLRTYFLPDSGIKYYNKQ
ncbi:MAG: hypothetical protein K6F51_09070 [Acetatifactor sp.]|nr:hypothetical protein [Acetatifactor sp.]